MSLQTRLVRSLGIEEKRTALLYYISFFVWPFGVMVDGLRHWRQPWAKNVFWLFCIFFGYAFIISENVDDSADSARYAQTLIEYSSSNLDLRSLFRSFYSASSTYVDIAQPLITFMVSRFTSDPRILFAVFAFIFGYFHSRNVWYLLNKIKGELNFIVLLFLFVFVLLNPIWSINGFRMWTGAQIFLFGAIPYLFEGKLRLLIWPVLSVFFHFSFIIPLLILFIYIVFKNRITIYIVLFIATSFIKEIDLQALHSYLSFLPSVFQLRTAGYTNLDYAESLTMAVQALNWYIPFVSKALAWVIYLIVIYIYFFSRTLLKEREGLMCLFCFAVLFYSIANILSLVPSGGRFINVASTFMFGLFVLFLSHSRRTVVLDVVKGISVPLLLLFSLVMIRAGMDYFGLSTIIGNPLFTALGAKSAPLIQEIKGLL